MFRPYSRDAPIDYIVGPYYDKLGRWHTGIDIVMPVGNPVLAALDGTVFYLINYAQNSYIIYVQHNFQGLTFWTGYMHVKDPVVGKGQQISVCERIADSYGDPNVDPLSGSSHIQFDIFLEDPTKSSLDIFNSPITEESWRYILDAMSFCD